jgi:GNAT superfamily N-acetyltransferase
MHIVRNLKSLDALILGCVDLEDILDLRHRILRDGLPVESAYFPGDDHEQTVHFGVMLSDGFDQPVGAPICCATVMLNKYEEKPAWQLRGMATEPEYKRRGIGKTLLKFVEQAVARRKLASMMWCNARLDAVQFYEKNDWKPSTGVIFEIENAGLHVKMYKPCS